MAATVYEMDSCNGDGTRERQKSNRFILAKQQLCTHITPTIQLESQCLTSRFVENVNRRQQLSFSFHELKSSTINEIG